MFVVNMVVIDLMWKMVATNVINWLIGVIAKFNAIVKICKYRKFHERHHFIPMAMEMHDTPECDKDHFIKECVHLSHDRWSRSHLSFFFAFSFSSRMLVLFFNMIWPLLYKERLLWWEMFFLDLLLLLNLMILLVGDIRGAVDEMVPYHKKD